jgi:hypothetical protein
MRFSAFSRDRQKPIRLAISAGVVALMYLTGVFCLTGFLYLTGFLSWRPFWSDFLGYLALMTICYALIGFCFSIYAASNLAIRWPIIPIGAAFGYLAGIIGERAVIMMKLGSGIIVDWYPPVWIAIVSGLLSNLFLWRPWLGGAIAGAIILVLYRNLVAPNRPRSGIIAIFGE